MSHFSVLVITPTKPSQTDLATILQPWHEFECTGVDDQYVIDVDVTDRLMEEWNEKTPVVRCPDGGVVNKYDDRHYTGKGEPGLLGESRKEFVLPAGCTIDEIPKSELASIEGQTIEEFAKEYGGWTRKEDGRFYDRTNPNKKWDWWSIGGRYSGKFVPNFDPSADPRNMETCWVCQGTGIRNDELGREHRLKDPTYKCNGCDGKGKMLKFPTQQAKVNSDQTQIKDIPIDALRTEKEQKAAKLYDKFHRIIAGRPVPSWDEIRERHGVENIDAARKEYHDNPVTVDLKKEDEFSWEIDERSFTCTRDEYLARARANAISCFALVKDGKWYEKGRMGWFACVADEKEEDQWTREVASLLDGLPPTTWITVVDCHI